MPTTINCAEIGRQIAAETIDEMPRLYAAARREDRSELLNAAANQIATIGDIADGPTGDKHRAQLGRLGQKFPQLVLRGTFQQQFACKLATRLALPRSSPMPASVMSSVIEPLVGALIDVLRLGAPATRDAAVEGLGGLLKLFPEPARRFPALPRLEVLREKDEGDQTFNERERISDEYFDRLERRHLMVMTIANDEASCAEFADHLKEPITTRVAGLLAMKEVPWKNVEDVLYSYPDLLRILPAVARQNSVISLNSTGLLCDAARLAKIDAEAPEWVTLAFARFQENVFRTIDTALRRCEWNWTELDDALSTAIRALPRGVDGTPSMCNARIRATVALVRTATRLITSAPAASTKAALKDLFSNIEAAAPWMNLGIMESAGRVLPDLLPHSEHDDLTKPMLQWLIRQFSRPHNFNDLVEVHGHLTANSCFRRIVASAMDSADSSNHPAEKAVRKLLGEPTTENIFGLRSSSDDLNGATDQKPYDIAPPVIAGIVFESELLARTSTILRRWEHATAFEKVLLARILALQLHALARDTREIERHSLLQRLFSNPAKGSTNRDDTDELAWELLSSLPAEAADPADAEIQRFIEFRGESSDESASLLPGYVLAMISTKASDRMAGSIAREVDLHLRSERSNVHAGDFARLLYQVTLRDPHESIFDHLLPRIRDKHSRATVSLFRRHVARLRKDTDDSDLDLPKIIRHFRTFSEELEANPATRSSETLEELRDALRAFTALTQATTDVWRALAAEKTIELIGRLDTLAGADPHRNPLATFKKRLTDLQDEVIHYLALPVGRFEERQRTLSRMIDAVAGIESSIRLHRGLQPPERTLLIALFKSQQVLFDGTRRWFCDEARKLKERNDRQGFWLYFCDPHTKVERFRAFSELERPALSMTVLDNLAHVQARIDSEPPEFPAQRAKFERFFVDWMTSELDVETLKKTLRERWSPFFRGIYAVTTSFWLTSLTMLAPFVLALWLDYSGHHEWEGIGFLVIAAGMLLAALFSLTPPLISGLLGKLWRGKRAAGPGYWFPCLLPRLARLTAVPMALIVEFDHSYEFPLHASSGSLLFLAALSLITTRFFVTRELVGQEEQSHITSDERKRVWQIVAVALAHSFAIAVVLSTIFASGHDVKTEGNDLQPSVEVHAGKPIPFWTLDETILEEVDKKQPGEKYRRFLGLVPRVVSVDFGAIAQDLGHPLPAKVADVKFQSYPTIILVWTALGLFFGVFLEGFMKGERLRGLTIDTTAAANTSE